jgi:hypothetical protein
MSAIPKKPAQTTRDYDLQFRELIPPSPNNGSAPSGSNPLTGAVPPEPYVDAHCVAEHLSLTRREVLKLTRARKLPAHAVDPSAVRKIYRYKLSEIDAMFSQTLTAEETFGFTTPSRHNDHRQPRDRRGKINGQREW